MASRISKIVFAPFQWLGLQRGGIALLAIVATVTISYLLAATRQGPADVVVQERIWAVKAIEVSPETVQPTLTVYGEVVVGRRGEIRALVPGLIVTIGDGFQEGARVKKGDLLVGIDPFTYENELIERQARLEQARAKLEILRLEHQRTKKLFKKGTVSEQILDQAFLKMRQQEAVIAEAEVGVRRAERDLEQTRLRAPFDGLLSDVNANLGKKLNVNDRVTDLIDTGRLEVKFSLSNSQFGRLLESGQYIIGRPVKISWNVGDKVLNYDGRIERNEARISSTTGGVSVYAVIEDNESLELIRPGAFVSVELKDKVYEDVMIIPDSALYEEDSVFVINGENRLEQRRIDIQGHDGSHILFRGAANNGVNPGDRVMTTQLREGGPGILVEVRQ